MGHRSKVVIYAMGNLEYISSDLLEEIAYSGIVLVHAPCGGNDFRKLLGEWSELNPSSPAYTVMLISCNYTMVDPYLFRPTRFTAFCVYPKDSRPVTLDQQPVAQKLSDIVPRDSWYGKPMHFCHVCNYPGYDEYNMLLHNQSEDHHRKLDKSRKRLISLPRETPLTNETSSYLLNESKKTFLLRKKRRKDTLY
ncbi:hypothetical protein F2Q68_00028457 [Brassica cretica]|uniref:NYN domain-containing protein n=1 Tax=Brassica cretica TaxID=69181 RepID=A0A8S9IFF6_BRACR|nr:hypothetical protein F2Q68_00028457 [Brassica cretica]